MNAKLMIFAEIVLSLRSEILSTNHKIFPMGGHVGVSCLFMLRVKVFAGGCHFVGSCGVSKRQHTF